MGRFWGVVITFTLWIVWGSELCGRMGREERGFENSNVVSIWFIGVVVQEGSFILPGRHTMIDKY